ncbi:hypothetical protein WICPIJ_003691 [Wickerhamomyces pijperi]|uniref:Dol-P-Glc:Glc(2)Man(9)GlcNAc(2)-PP-Dol alpha-1,2-glucosyltransferase n=1 Tax=Wickerhamomyces pijperi TaxID=599730 RepID=A0A9P8TNM3_WICPI|nr:hypothetical protein WICPIJ_003691 [Wickerhamomyces pijperi]
MSTNAANPQPNPQEEEEEEPPLFFPQIPGRDIEHELTTSLVFNWFIAWPILLITTIVLTIYTSKHTIPYKFIDEIFHISMTERYIQGDWAYWDPKITTPPGLYYLGFIWSQIGRIVPFVKSDGLIWLRLLNVVGGVVVLPYMLSGMFILNPIGFWVGSLIMCPILYCFNLVYYTDVWSTVLVVSALSIAVGLPYGDLRSCQISAGLLWISLWFRQTNVIWSLFVLVVVIERRAIIRQNFTDSELNNCIKFLIQFFEDFWEYTWPFLANVGSFVVFLIYNRGITLGDKENHSVGIHLMQVFYCFMFFTFLTVPVWFSESYVKWYAYRFKFAWFFVLLEMCLIWLCIRYFLVVHPFLLADNRHYTFYIFKYFINSPSRWIKYGVMGLVYHFSMFVTYHNLNGNKFEFSSITDIPFKETRDLPLKPTLITILALTGCMILTLVPSPLFEPRYYIVPFFIYRVFISVPFEEIWGGLGTSNVILKRLYLEFAYLLAFNAFILYVFIKKEVIWEGVEEIQRIIW